MNNKIILVTMLLLAAAIGSPKVFAAGPPSQVMAEILMHLDHKPTNAEKAQLRQIANDPKASDQVRTLANAMLNLQHKVADEDKPKLSAIAKDPKASAEDRDLANILLTINHHPSAADKEKLAKLVR